MPMFRKLVSTSNDFTLTIVRLVLGVTLLYARRTKDAGLVWRLWLPWHDGVLHPADGNSNAAGVPGNLRRILRWPWTSGWSAQPNCRARNHRQYAGRHRHRPPR